MEPITAPIQAGHFIGRALAEAGVRLAFTVPGESFLPLLDGVAAAGIRVVATRHEGGAAFMAAAVGSLTGRPAVVLATRAVGATNLGIGLHAAHADSAPLVALVGQVERSVRGREAFQEIDLAGTIGRLCRWTAEVRDAASLPAILDEALRKAMNGRPGPVLLALPADVLEDEVPPGHGHVAAGPLLGPPRAPSPDPAVVRRILHLLLDAERPVILAGAGVLRSRSTADLVKLAETIDVPVIAGWRRPDVFPNDHALYLGMSGYFAAPTVRERLLAADAILVLGSRLDEVASFGYEVPAAGTRWAHVDLEPHGARAGLGGPTIALAADARTFVREARRVLGGAALDAGSLERRREANVADRAAWEAASVVDATPWDGPGVHPGRIVATLGRVLPPDAIVTTDAGHFGGWAARGLRFRRPGTFIGTTAGAMGFGLPAAIAASLVAPGRPVVALAGDGGFAMTMAELETAVREGAHPVALVMDNARYQTIRDQQDRRGFAPLATDLGPIDFVGVAQALGARAVRVEDDEGLEPALRDALAARLMTVIHLPVDRRWVSVDRLAGELEELPEVRTAAPAVDSLVAEVESEPASHHCPAP
ncbi:MAG: thiamine pyrophosphate-binding protein, partial [Chloroflexi bacterium]|nr:thiamine pyrophosphate-binding protein [Chloroflexota bacterium]